MWSVADQKVVNNTKENHDPSDLRYLLCRTMMLLIVYCTFVQLFVWGFIAVPTFHELGSIWSLVKSEFLFKTQELVMGECRQTTGFLEVQWSSIPFFCFLRAEHIGMGPQFLAPQKNQRFSYVENTLTNWWNWGVSDFDRFWPEPHIWMWVKMEDLGDHRYCSS